MTAHPIESSRLAPDVSGALLVLIASTAAVGGFLFGFDTAVINGAVLAIRGHFEANAWTTGLAVSMALLGSGAGALLAGPFADRYGRVRAMIVASVMFTLSAIGSGVPITIWDFIFWRVLGGVAVGAASVIAPAYIAEISPASWRGRLGSLQQLAIVIGIFIALLLNYVIAASAGGAANPWWFGAEAWRWMFWSEIPAAVLYGVAALFIPESPRYLIAQDRNDEAREVLRRVVGREATDAKVAEIQQTLAGDHKPAMRDIRGPALGLLPIVWVGIGLSVFQQFIGINVIFYYSSTLWRAVGFSEADALWVTVITSVVNVATTLIAIAVIDKIGRKPLLLLGSAGMIITLATVSIIFWGVPVVDGQLKLTGTPAVIALIAANLYVCCFGFSWGPVVWVLLGEMFPNRIRAAALSVAAMIQWVANFIVSTTFPPLAGGLGLGPTYGIYTLMAVLSFIFVLRMVRETKGKELEEMTAT